MPGATLTVSILVSGGGAGAAGGGVAACCASANEPAATRLSTPRDPIIRLFTRYSSSPRKPLPIWAGCGVAPVPLFAGPGAHQAPQTFDVFSLRRRRAQRHTHRPAPFELGRR